MVSFLSRSREVPRKDLGWRPIEAFVARHRQPLYHKRDSTSLVLYHLAAAQRARLDGDACDDGWCAIWIFTDRNTVVSDTAVKLFRAQRALLHELNAVLARTTLSGVDDSVVARELGDTTGATFRVYGRVPEAVLVSDSATAARQAAAARERQIADLRSSHPTWSLRTAMAIADGRAVVGMSPEMVRLALGAPDCIQTRETRIGMTEVWEYGGKLRVTFENGAVSEVVLTRQGR